MNVRDLQKKVESQHEQIKLYERKLKDLVRAYKSLDAEKSALQAALNSIIPQETDGHNESSESVERIDNNLKTAIATLTRETSKKEAAFLSDKKILLNENVSLKEQLKRASENLENAEKTVKSLQQKLQEIEIEREKEVCDHGKVVAEMQTRYAKEHKLLEAGTKETAALCKKINQKEETINQLRTREAQLIFQVSALSKEVNELTEKACHVPSIQFLKDEMANLKIDHERELVDAVMKTKHTTQAEEQNRASTKIAELEERTIHLLQAIARSEEERNYIYEAFMRSQFENATLSDELSRLHSCQHGETNDAVARLKSAVVEIREKEPEFDIFTVTGPDPDNIRLQLELTKLRGEYEQCKSRLDAVTASNAQLAVNTEMTGEDRYRAVVEQFQIKIQNLVALHAKDKAIHEKASRDLHARISELEQREGQLVVEMRREMNNRISEMEHEMQKQRSRTIHVIAEKERELEAARSVLALLESEQISAPTDALPVGRVSLSRKMSSEHQRYLDRRNSTRSRKSVDTLSVHSIDAATVFSADGTGVPIPTASESRNIYYEEELLKKEREIQELRNVSHAHSYRLREMEQVALVKELEHHKKIETLCEEINELRNKLALFSSGGEMEYLRNIFIQFIQSSSSSAKKNILRAMGMALKISANEMKTIDSRNIC